MDGTPPPLEPMPPAEVRARLPPDGGPDFNRLVHETSPYLLQHARNPVDWFPWGAEALEKAKREDKPIFLSLGYSSCHWCHVMEHESFENGEVAQLLNTLCVPVKVDREERPDLDDLYMTATQIITGRGGWPNSVWLLADGRPWYAGTYFPREDRAGSPGFKTLLRRLDEVWKDRRADVEQQADALAKAIRENAAAAAQPGPALRPGQLTEMVSNAVAALGQDYDRQNGGFGGAPKFPPHSALRLLLREYELSRQPAILDLVTGTLDAMQAGGIRDHVGGGFHRYSTDARWFLPHFEKMLYDNAQLARLYAEAFRVTTNGAYAETARSTFDWVLRDMKDPAGGFHSALDADSEGEEGRFYVWTHAQVEAVLGQEPAARFAQRFGFTDRGNFREEATGNATGANIPFRASSDRSDPSDQSDAVVKLREARDQRVWPSRDDKVLTAWNGLMIGALAIGSRDLQEPRYRQAAEQAAEFFLAKMQSGDRLLRTWRDGRARIPGFLDDYAALADGLLDLHEVTREIRWRDAATGLARDMVRLFRDERDGAFFFTATDHEQLLTRSKDAFDQAVPSGNGLAARVLLRIGKSLGQRTWTERGGDVVRTFAPVMARSALGAGTLLEAAAMYAEEAGFSPFARKGPITLLMADSMGLQDGKPADVTLRLLIDDGWHINAHEGVAEDRVATVLTAGDHWSVTYPSGHLGEFGDTKQRIYEGEVLLRARFTGPEETLKDTRPVSFRLRTQPCDATRCLPPVELEIGAAAWRGDLRPETGP